MPYTTLSDGLPLYYEETGQGSPVVFVPGWTMTTAMWRHQVEYFSESHRVIALDLRGAGRSGKTRDRHSLIDYATDVDELLDELRLTGAAVVAWAMGVSVTVHLLAILGTPRVSGFVWVDHSPSFLTEAGWEFPLGGDFTKEDLDKMCRMQLSDRVAAVDNLLELMFHHPLGEADREAFYRSIFQTPSAVAESMLRQVATTDLRPLLGRVTVPTLVVNGEKSVVPHGVCGWLASHLSEGRCRLIADAGHAPFWDAPEAFNSVVAEFVSGL